MYAYEFLDRPESFPNLRHAAQAPWRGLTAFIQGRPFLVIDKDSSTYTLEGEDGNTIKLERFIWSGTVSDEDRLVAASRIAGSPLRRGTLYYDDVEGWLVIDDDGKRFNVETAVKHLEKFNWYTSALKLTAIQGEFIHEMDGRRVRFREADHMPGDKTVGAAEYWVVDSEEGETFYISEAGLVLDQVNNIVGRFDPYVDPDPDRYEHEEGWYEDWDGPVAKIAAEVRARSSVVPARYASMPFIYNDVGDQLWIGNPGDLHSDLLYAFPDALEAYSEAGDTEDYTADDFIYAAAGYIRIRQGNWSTEFYNSDYSHLEDIVLELAQQEIQLEGEVESKVAAEGYSIRGNTGGTTGRVEGTVVRPDRQSKEEILKIVDTMPGHEEDRARQRELIPEWAINRGGSTDKNAWAFGPGPIRMETEDSQSMYACGNCGWKGTDARWSYGYNAHICPKCEKVVYPAKTAAPFEPGQGAPGGGGQPVTYAPGVILVSQWVMPDQNWLLYHDRCVGIIAEAGGLTSHGVVVARERNIPIVIDAREATRIQPGDKIRMDGETGVIDVNGGGGDIDRMAPGQQAAMGVTRFVWSMGQSMTAPIPQDDPESGKLHQEMMMELDADGRWDWEDFAFGTVYDDGHADILGQPSDREALEAFVHGLGAQELVEIQDMAMLGKVAEVTYPAGQEQQIANLMRQIVDAQNAGNHEQAHALKQQLESLLGGNPFMARQAAEGKHPAGTRVQLEHPKFKGQRGTITECGGKHKHLDEEHYKILLDSGEEVDEIMESHFKKIKSANFEEVDTPGMHFLDTLKFADEQADYTAKGDDPVVCPKCGSHTVRAFGADSDGDAKMKCLTCGADFQREVFKNPEAKVALDKRQEDILRSPFDWEREVQDFKDEGTTVSDSRCPACGSNRVWGHAFDDDLGSQHSQAFCGNCGAYLNLAEGGGYVDTGMRAGFSPDPRRPGGPANRPSNPKWDFNSPRMIGSEKEADMQKGSPYPENSDKNAPDHSPKGQKLPKKVNSIYNACMREADGKSDDQQEKCMKIAWAQYKKMKDSSNENDLFHDMWDEDEDEISEVRVFVESKTAVAADSNGNELQPGQWYVMHSTQYKVPDVIRVLNVDGNRIEAAIEGDNKGHFPLAITQEEIERNGYSFEPYEDHDEPEEVRTSSWKLSRKAFTPGQQRDLINENLQGRARNFDRLNLDGTHYPSQDTEDDPFFLW